MIRNYNSYIDTLTQD